MSSVEFGVGRLSSFAQRRLACGELAHDGRLAEARSQFSLLAQEAADESEIAAVLSDLGAVAAADGHFKRAARQWKRALMLDAAHGPSARNLATLFDARKLDGSAGNSPPQPTRIAIVSLLFNWPSTGGGTVHTKELADALQADCFDVCHIYAVYEPWGMGNVRDALAVPSVPLKFETDEWSAEAIRVRFREAVDEFSPDAVIIADSWNTKPLLAEAVADYPYYLRLAALETICPLNNVRLLFDNGNLVQCDRNQLSDPGHCQNCLRSFAQYSGGLHHVERELAGVHLPDYPQRLRRAYKGAAAILAVNPMIAELVRPFCRRVEVIPSGFDGNRFPPPVYGDLPEVFTNARPVRFIFAGLIDEPMKGFSVLFDACRQLWEGRRDFELVVTSERREEIDAPFLRWIGWQSQHDLPDAIRSSDVLVFPTIAQEALGRTAVEAMGCGKPVIASRLGGLPWVVDENKTGLLATPGDPLDLAGKMMQLMDDAPLRRTMGQAGRIKFESQFLWPVILKTRYRPLFQHLVV